MKKAFIISILLASTLLLNSCGSNSSEENIHNNTGNQTEDTTPPKEEDTDPTQLNTPTVQFDKGTITWNKVNNAAKYEVLVNGELITTYNTFFTLNGIKLTPTEYTVQVKAISENPDYLNSEFSTELKFDTYILPAVIIDKVGYPLQSPYDNNRSITELLINKNGADYYRIYINGLYIEENSSSILHLYSSQFETGYNTLEIYSYSKYSYDVDGDKVSLTVYKNPAYSNIRFEDGDILYTKDGTDFVYSNLDIGDGTKEIRNDEPPPKDISINIALSSEPTYIWKYKIADPEIYSCTYTETVKNQKGKIDLKLKNYDPSYVGNGYEIGYYFDTIVISVYDIFGLVTTQAINVTMGEYYTDCSFEFDITRFASDMDYVTIQLKKDGCISSNVVKYDI